MSKQSKKYQSALRQYDRLKLYRIEEAMALIKKTAFSKCDETVDIALRLGVDPKYADQMVRGAVTLPHGTGKTVRVLVFAKGEKVAEALAAGADFVGSDEYLEKIKEGWLDFDRVLATPDVMGLVGRIGKILGPRGLMPNPKVGTVTFDLANGVRQLKAGRIEFRTEKTGGIIHSQVGKVSFDVTKLNENALALVDTVLKLKPSSSKGTYLVSVVASSTFGPGIKIDPADLVRTLR